MKTLQEHNDEKTALERALQGLQANVSCDQCATPMVYENALEVLPNGKQRVKCPKCGYRGTKIV